MAWTDPSIRGLSAPPELRLLRYVRQPPFGLTWSKVPDSGTLLVSTTKASSLENTRDFFLPILVNILMICLSAESELETKTADHVLRIWAQVQRQFASRERIPILDPNRGPVSFYGILSNHVVTDMRSKL